MDDRDQVFCIYDAVIISRIKLCGQASIKRSSTGRNLGQHQTSTASRGESQALQPGHQPKHKHDHLTSHHHQSTSLRRNVDQKGHHHLTTYLSFMQLMQLYRISSGFKYEIGWMLGYQGRISVWHWGITLIQKVEISTQLTNNHQTSYDQQPTYKHQPALLR